ncbi:glycoside hydrolase family 3 C-terminal domain-containing protein [Acidocella sp.]|uniref:glycoside hydrolase family 3 C-terminal domain-containing protein n=1 Tax=Acidocella sp. TaxID=50710 RepID=UPI002602D816|nr:glycoside hydrolase family 3 C-terminal domain-containing protein [Acidocella sp.]
MRLGLVLVAALCGLGAARAETPDQRAKALMAKLTLGQELALLHGNFALRAYDAAYGLPPAPPVPGALGSAGYVAGIPALGIPALQEVDGGLGVSVPPDAQDGHGSTPLPSGLALAAGFDPAMAYAAGAMMGREAFERGFNVLLAGGVNLTRDPRGGRNYEYLGEDPLLAGTLDGALIHGVQDQHVLATLKHFAMNDQETNRQFDNAVIGEAAFRESDGLAFEIALETGHPMAVMCAYNQVNGQYACASHHLLDDVLKRDWGFTGFVMSDWGAVHSALDINAGLDQESGEEFDPVTYFSTPLAVALSQGKVARARVDDAVRRILRAELTVGLMDHPPVRAPIDFAADGAVAEQEEAQGLVLLKNTGLLPLSPTVRRIAVIGGYANAGVMSGGGSSDVVPKTLPQLLPVVQMGEGLAGIYTRAILDPDAPLAEIERQAPGAEVRYDPGLYPSQAARLAKWADVAVVFAPKWETESQDVPDLSLPAGEDALIAAVAAANPRTVVVLETGNPVLMPWLPKVGGVVEAWYPGAEGGKAIARALFGRIDPSGHLPMSFPASTDELPRPVVPGQDAAPGQITPVDYNIEGAEVGYRWFAARHLPVLFPFGFGLSYTSFRFSHLRLGPGLGVSFDVCNTGKVAGATVAQLYLTARNGVAMARLAGFARVALAPGETRHVSLTLDPRVLADFDVAADDWALPGGTYRFGLGDSAADLTEGSAAHLRAQRVAP